MEKSIALLHCLWLFYVCVIPAVLKQFTPQFMLDTSHKGRSVFFQQPVHESAGVDVDPS